MDESLKKLTRRSPFGSPGQQRAAVVGVASVVTAACLSLRRSVLLPFVCLRWLLVRLCSCKFASLSLCCVAFAAAAAVLFSCCVSDFFSSGVFGHGSGGPCAADLFRVVVRCTGRERAPTRVRARRTEPDTS